jgi:hypothetical protein
VALLARSRRDCLDRALAGEVESCGRESGEREIGGAGRKRLGHHAIALIGRHRKVDALGLEVAGRETTRRYRPIYVRRRGPATTKVPKRGC